MKLLTIQFYEKLIYHNNRKGFILKSSERNTLKGGTCTPKNLKVILKTTLGTVISFFVLLFLSFVLSPKEELYHDISFSPVITDRNDAILRIALTHDEKYRIFTTLDNINPHMIEATLLYEDREFYEHSGVNFLSIFRAMYTMATGGRRMGASTITMQLVRLSQPLKTNTVAGKLTQMWQAMALEYHYTKNEILEAYLNLAPYGGNIEGVGAASRVWFHKDPQYLNMPEIIALAVVPQNPVLRNPARVQNTTVHSDSILSPPTSSAPMNSARERLSALWKERYPNEIQSVFSRMPLKVYHPRDLPFEAPHLTSEILLNKRFTTEATDSITDYTNGDSNKKPIKTTLDLNMQKSIEKIVLNYTKQHALLGFDNASVMVANWQSGEILSLVGSANYYNVEIDGQVDGTVARRSPGSTLKPFIYTLALEQGIIHPQTVLADTQKSFAGYEPENADREFLGPLSAKKALQLSRNIPAIHLQNILKYPDLYDFLKSAGVQFTHSKNHYGLSLVLGGAEVSMRELVNLYAVLPNKGMYKPLTYLTYSAENAKEAHRVLKAESSYITLDMMQMPSPFGNYDGLSWKTGTSNAQRDAWTIGIFGPYVVAVWVGDFSGKRNPNLTGVKAAVPLFFELFHSIRSYDVEGRKNYLPALRQGLNIREIPVCASTGDIQIGLCAPSLQTKTLFIPGMSPIKNSGILREIIIDKETGFRVCREKADKTEKVVWEFWPSDMLNLFRQAGVYKQPLPPHSLDCTENHDIVAGDAPVIQSPSKGLIYHQSFKAKTKIPLIAQTDADASLIYWFANKTYIGMSKPQEVLLWEATAGKVRLRAVDDLGRFSLLDVQINSIP